MIPREPRVMERDLPPAMREALALVRELRTTARQAGIRSSDPLHPVIDAFANAIAKVAIDRQGVIDQVARHEKLALDLERTLADLTATTQLMTAASGSSNPHRILNGWSTSARLSAVLLLAVIFALGWYLRTLVDRVTPAWPDLAAWNGTQADVLAGCRQQFSARIVQGRRTCEIWIDPPL
jgi:hypothetical protein